MADDAVSPDRRGSASYHGRRLISPRGTRRTEDIFMRVHFDPEQLTIIVTGRVDQGLVNLHQPSSELPRPSGRYNRTPRYSVAAGRGAFGAAGARSLMTRVGVPCQCEAP